MVISGTSSLKRGDSISYSRILLQYWEPASEELSADWNTAATLLDLVWLRCRLFAKAGYAVLGADRFGGVVFAPVVLPNQPQVPEIRLQGVSNRCCATRRRGGLFAVERLPHLSFAPDGRRVSWHSNPGRAVSCGGTF